MRLYWHCPANRLAGAIQNACNLWREINCTIWSQEGHGESWSQGRRSIMVQLLLTQPLGDLNLLLIKKRIGRHIMIFGKAVTAFSVMPEERKRRLGGLRYFFILMDDVLYDPYDHQDAHYRSGNDRYCNHFSIPIRS